MKISTKGRYALEAVLDLAYHSSDELESLKNIADRLDKSKNYLEQLFVILRQNGIVESIRGAQGGYKLAKPAKKITAGEVIRAVEGELVPVACLVSSKDAMSCSRYKSCVSRLLWKGMSDEIDKVVDSVTIEDLVLKYRDMKKETIEYFI
ncbi:MAG: Rrf2 family transcriptional regulator [Eubacteriaceae bacterium]|nr:Rrf2 family transcriptional regulator [Eubacteriaceae bacterium]